MMSTTGKSLGHYAGQSVGTFHLVRMLGTGAMGAVYLAKDSVLRRDVAVKVLSKGDDDDHDEDRLERFLREARAAARLIHPHVVQIFQIGETDELRYIAMEYVEGWSMRREAKRLGGRISEPRAIQWMREAADALRLADSLGICHRDIKPHNLLVTTTGVLKIADFGLAAQIGGHTIGRGSGTQIEGTPSYMSPEHWETQAELTSASDIYSLGCTFYHLLVGAPPFLARDLLAAFHAHCSAPVPDARDSVPELDPILTDLIRRCMAKRPEARPKAAELVEVLDDMYMHRRLLARSKPPATLQETLSLTIGPSESAQLDRPPDTGPPSASSSQQSYREYFSLKGYPFSDMRQPAFFWGGNPFADALGALTSQIAARQQPIMLLGAPGSGRTFICEILQHKLPGAHVFSVEPQLLFGSRLFFTLARQAGVTVNPSASQRILVEAFLSKALPQDPGATAIVVVDGVEPDDQGLLAELNSILSSLPRGRVTLLLIGREDLPEALARAGAPPRLLPAFPPVTLRALTQEEMMAYIEFRMEKLGGWRGFKLDAAVRQLLHSRSRGNPKLVNIYCHNALILAALKQEQTIRFDTIRLAMNSKSYLTPETARPLLAGRL